MSEVCVARECGRCSMCCKLPSIEEFGKPANQWCRHISKASGCAIYETRYDTCRGYRCLWLLNDDLGPEWQPNKCKFIIHKVEGSVGLWVNVDKSFPMAWKQEPFYQTIKSWSQQSREGKGYVAVCVGSRTIVVFPEEDMEIVGVQNGADLKVGYRHHGGQCRPLVVVRNNDGSVVEHLGSATG